MENTEKKKKIDRRIRKTKKQLQTALLDLMKDKNINDISVKELVERADINRSTFYLHYASIHDILQEIETAILGEIQNIFGKYPPNHPSEETFPFITDLSNIIFDNLEACKILFGPNSDKDFLEEIQRLLGDKISERLRYLHGSDYEISAYLSAFYINGCVGMLRAWQYDENRLPPQEMARLCYKLVMATLEME